MARKRVVSMPLAELVLDFELYPRPEVDAVHVRDLVDALQAGDELPPPIVCAKSKRVVDGFHRVRAHKRVLGPEGSIAVELRDYADDGDLFADAASMNARHGRRLTPYDHRRIIAKAQELGRTIADVSEWLRVPATTLERRSLAGTAERRVIPLKRTVAHLDQQELTPAQITANERAGGMNQLFYVNQLLNLVESGSLDLNNGAVMAAVGRLRIALEALPALEPAAP